MRKRIILNDQGLYVDCIISDDIISFEFESGLEVLNNKVRLYKDGDSIYGILGLKRFVRINKNGINKVMSITSTEIRILCAFANRVDYLLKHKKEGKPTILSEFYSVVKNLYSLPKGWNKKQLHHTELHTHFTEILNPYEFINFINKYNVTYPINDEGELDFKNGIGVSYEELVKLGYKDKLINALRLDISGQSSFRDLTHVVNEARKSLLDRIINNNSLEVVKDRDEEEYKKLESELFSLRNQMDDIKKSNMSKKQKGSLRNELNNKLSVVFSKRKHLVTNYLYDDLLNASLDKLSKEKVEYSEISFSNEHRLLYLSEEHKHDDRFNLLYSIDRKDSVKEYKEYSKNLEELLNTDKVIGVDIMGFEEPLRGEERDNFKKKFLWLLPVLHIHPNSVFRIHASEFKDSSDNMFETLKIIDECAKELNDACSDLFGREWGVIPPPRIRIGHGVNINEKPELIKLLQKYDVVVEINASSNYALGNIDSTNQIPLKYYDENEISYVISTDGGGVYSTSINQEENILGIKDEEGSSIKKEKEQINSNGSGIPSKEDVMLYQQIKDYQENIVVEEKYDSFSDALVEEQKRVENKDIKSQVNDELKDLTRYIMDHDVELDSKYYRSMISIIEKLNESNKSDYSRMFLYLFERDCFPKRETPFKTIYYIDNLKKEKEKLSFLENSLDRLFKVVNGEYINVSNQLKNDEDYFNKGGIKR